MQKAMKAVSHFPGVHSISIDVKDKKLTVIGDVDPVQVMVKLRKNCRAEIVSVGPFKGPKKKDEGKEGEKDAVTELMKAYEADNTDWTIQYVQSAEENPNACVIS